VSDTQPRTVNLLPINLPVGFENHPGIVCAIGSCWHKLDSRAPLPQFVQELPLAFTVKTEGF
jgi:hypothetical protein